jgi:hypothetical protein
VIPDALRAALAARPAAHAATLTAAGVPRRSQLGALATWDARNLLLAGLGDAAIGDLGRNPAIELAVLDPLIPGGWHLRGFAVVLAAGELHRRACLRLGAVHGEGIVLMQVDRARRGPGPANETDPTPAQAA